MDAKDFLTSAQQSIQGCQEVDYRNAASRGYYCAYHVCKTFLEKLPKQGSVGDSHEKIIAELLSHSDKNLQKLGRQLEQAKILRHRADYKLAVKFAQYEARKSLTQVQQILSAVEEYLSASKL
jgi:uncharacterized protein (UPF0332 family)